MIPFPVDSPKRLAYRMHLPSGMKPLQYVKPLLPRALGAFSRSKYSGKASQGRPEGITVWPSDSRKRYPPTPGRPEWYIKTPDTPVVRKPTKPWQS